MSIAVVASQLTLPAMAHNLPIVLGAFLVHVGVWSFTSPTAVARTYGVPVPSSTVNPWILSFGSRDLGYGCAILMLAYDGDWRALGIVLATLLVAGVADIMITVKYGVGGWSRAIKVHGPGTLLVAVLAPYLILE